MLQVKRPKRDASSSDFDEDASLMKGIMKSNSGGTPTSALSELNLARPPSDRGIEQRGFSNEHRLFRSAPASSSAFPSETTLNQRVPFL